MLSTLKTSSVILKEEEINNGLNTNWTINNGKKQK